jgi:hypothetical protein
VTNPGSAVIVYEASLRSSAAVLEDVGKLGAELSEKVRDKSKDGYNNAWWDAAAAGKAFCQQLASDSAACRGALSSETTFNPGSIVATYEGVLAEPRGDVGVLGRKLSQVVRDKNYSSSSWDDAVKVGRGFLKACSDEPGPALALQVGALVNPGSYVMTYEASLETCGQEAWRAGTAAVNAVMSRSYPDIAAEGLKVAEVYAAALPPESLGGLLSRVSVDLDVAPRLAFLRDALEQPAPGSPQKSAEAVLQALANAQGVRPEQADQVAREALRHLMPGVSDPAMTASMRKGIDSNEKAEPVRVLDMLAHMEFLKPSASTVVEEEDFVQILGSRVKVRKPAAPVAEDDGGSAQIRPRSRQGTSEGEG